MRAGLGALLVAAGGLAGCAPEIDGNADLLGGEVDVPGGAAADAVARVTKGPIVQDVTPSGATFVWETDVAARSVVEVAPAGAGWAGARAASGRTFVLRYVPALEWYAPAGGYVHEARVEGLGARAAYAYRVTSAAAPVGGTFRTAPAGPAEFTAVLFGDNRGAAARFAAVIQAARAVGPELVLATGDLVGEGSNDSDWQSFFDVAAPLLRDVPFYSSLGNHDVWKYGLPRFDAYFAAPIPRVPYAIGRKFLPDARDVYSFDWGRAHFVMLNSNGAATTAAQTEWLKKDLADARARRAAPVLAFMHHPLFTCADHEPALALRDVWWPLLRDGGVTAVIAGHNHVYERFVVDGITAITSGGAGAPTYDPEYAPERPEAKFRVSASGRLHVIRLDVHASGAAEATVIDAEGGAVLDRWALPAR